MPPDRAFVGMERELKEIQKTFRTAYALIFRISMAMENSSTVVNETLLGVDTTLRNIHRNFSTVKDEVVEVLQKFPSRAFNTTVLVIVNVLLWFLVLFIVLRIWRMDRLLRPRKMMSRDSGNHRGSKRKHHRILVNDYVNQKPRRFQRWPQIMLPTMAFLKRGERKGETKPKSVPCSHTRVNRPRNNRREEGRSSRRLLLPPPPPNELEAGFAPNDRLLAPNDEILASNGDLLIRKDGFLIRNDELLKNHDGLLERIDDFLAPDDLLLTPNEDLLKSNSARPPKKPPRQIDYEKRWPIPLAVEENGATESDDSPTTTFL